MTKTAICTALGLMLLACGPEAQTTGASGSTRTEGHISGMSSWMVESSSSYSAMSSASASAMWEYQITQMGRVTERREGGSSSESMSASSGMQASETHGESEHHAEGQGETASSATEQSTN